MGSREMQRPCPRIRARPISNFDSAHVEGPPTPSNILARLGVLLVIALGLALAAQLVVGVPH